MYVTVSVVGTISFRFDYRLNGRRETLTLGRYGPDGISLAVARARCVNARRASSEGRSPAQEKQRERRRLAEAQTFQEFSDQWAAGARMAASTRSMRMRVLSRYILPAFKSRMLTEITADVLRAPLQQGQGARSAGHRGPCPRHRQADLWVRDPAWREGGEPG
jgi:hypothetical protein